MSKLTLSVDDTVVRLAKRYAKARGTSVSRLVEGFLRLLAKPPEDRDLPPVTRRLRGSLKGGDPGEYRRYLERKYR